jgi:hypothetical protein
MPDPRATERRIARDGEEAMGREAWYAAGGIGSTRNVALVSIPIYTLHTVKHRCENQMPSISSTEPREYDGT